MRTQLLAILGALLLVAAVSHAQVVVGGPAVITSPPMDPSIGLAGIPQPANLGYVPMAVPFDNPSEIARPVNAIPATPDCTVRPQTVVEIKRMRRSAARIAQMIQTEVLMMEKRKTYVEQMTAYLNDRIRELNKVKSELDQETRWIEMSNKRIKELASKEELIKMQDILGCLNADATRLDGQKASQATSITDLTTRTTAIQTKITALTKGIQDLRAGAHHSP